MTTEIGLLLGPLCLVIGWVGFVAARGRREPVAPGKLLKEGVRLAIIGALVAILVAYVLNGVRVLADLLCLMVFAELSRVVGEELGNAVLRTRLQSDGDVDRSAR